MHRKYHVDCKQAAQSCARRVPSRCRLACSQPLHFQPNLAEKYTGRADLAVWYHYSAHGARFESVIQMLTPSFLSPAGTAVAQWITRSSAAGQQSDSANGIIQMTADTPYSRTWLARVVHTNIAKQQRAATLWLYLQAICTGATFPTANLRRLLRFQ